MTFSCETVINDLKEKKLPAQREETSCSNE